MKSELPKVLIPVLGRPMIEYVLDALEACQLDEVLVVVGYRADLVREALAGRQGLRFVDQTEQLGTGHAVQMCRPALEGFAGSVLVVTGDSPLVQVDSLRRLFDAFESGAFACLLGTTYKDDPTGLGRIVRDSEGRFEAIVEQRDATPEQAAIREVNMSTYLFAGPDLLWALGQLQANNAQREYYLTDCPGALKRAGRPVGALPLLKPIESLSINTPDELRVVEQAMEQWLGAR